MQVVCGLVSLSLYRFRLVEMYLVSVVVLLLSCVFNSGVANESPDSSTIVQEIVTDVNGTSKLIVFCNVAYATVTVSFRCTGSVLQWTVVKSTASVNANDADEKAPRSAPSQATPKHAKPKLCNGHLGKQECTFKPHVRSSPSRFQSKKNTQETETVLFDFFNLSMVLCSAVMLPTSYILFISLLK